MFSTQATIEDDFTVPVTILTIPAESVRGAKHCIDVNVIDDYLKEGRESFSIEVSSVTTNSTIEFGNSRSHITVGSVEVIIIDDDGKYCI